MNYFKACYLSLFLTGCSITAGHKRLDEGYLYVQDLVHKVEADVAESGDTVRLVGYGFKPIADRYFWLFASATNAEKADFVPNLYVFVDGELMDRANQLLVGDAFPCVVVHGRLSTDSWIIGAFGKTSVVADQWKLCEEELNESDEIPWLEVCNSYNEDDAICKTDRLN